MNTALHKTNGPASVGALPDRGSIIPEKDRKMNETTDSTENGAAPASALDRLIKQVETTYAAWIGSVGPEEDLPMNEECRAYDNAEETLISFPCATHEEVKKKLAFLCGRETGAARTALDALNDCDLRMSLLSSLLGDQPAAAKQAGDRKEWELLKAIYTHKAEWNQYLADALSNDDAPLTHQASLDRLSTWSSPAQNWSEAAAALEFATEMLEIGDCDAVPAMIKAAHGWIKSEAGRRAAQ